MTTAGEQKLRLYGRWLLTREAKARAWETHEQARRDHEAAERDFRSALDVDPGDFELGVAMVAANEKPEDMVEVLAMFREMARKAAGGGSDAI